MLLKKHFSRGSKTKLHVWAINYTTRLAKLPDSALSGLCASLRALIVQKGGWMSHPSPYLLWECLIRLSTLGRRSDLMVWVRHTLGPTFILYRPDWIDTPRPTT